MKANAFGCYMLNGVSVIDFKEHSKKEDVGEFLITIRQKNPNKEIVIFCDNFNSHKANYTKKIAEDISINLVFLPKYSPDLNPIEYIWKSIKRVISRSFIRDVNHMRSIIQDSFLENASKLSFAGYWIERFLGGNNWYKELGFLTINQLPVGSSCYCRIGHEMFRSLILCTSALTEDECIEMLLFNLKNEHKWLKTVDVESILDKEYNI